MGREGCGWRAGPDTLALQAFWHKAVGARALTLRGCRPGTKHRWAPALGQ